MSPAGAQIERMKRRSVATRYATLVVALLSAALIASETLETWVSHRDRKAALEVLQREKARAAAAAVSRFGESVLRNLDFVTLAAAPAAGDDLERRRLQFLKLLRLAPTITTATLVDSNGRERLRVSRIKTDRLDSGIDLSGEPGFSAARAGRPYFGNVHFVAQPEPYLTIAALSAARDGSVALADVNLKFVRTVVSEIKVGATGYACCRRAWPAGLASEPQPRPADGRPVAAAAGAGGQCFGRERAGVR